MDQTLRQLGELALGAVPTVILFVLVWILYRLIVHGALASALAERRSKTVGAVEKAKGDISAAEQKTAEYERKIREARTTVYQTQESRRQQVLEQKMMAIAQAKATAEAMISSARTEIKKETEIAKTRVQAESSSLAGDIIRAILRTESWAKQPVLGGRA